MVSKSLVGIAIASVLVALYFSQTTAKYDYEADFVNFVQEYRRSYFSKDEYSFRLGVFTENMKKNEEMNANPNDEAIYGVTTFADWTHEEFMKLNKLRPEELSISEDVQEHVVSDHNLRDSDLRKSGKIRAIKNQGSCGSCWAFAANGAHEFALGGSVDLSEQQYVDCSRGQGNQGCNGGWYHYAWNYAKGYGITT